MMGDTKAGKPWVHQWHELEADDAEAAGSTYRCSGCHDFSGWVNFDELEWVGCEGAEKDKPPLGIGGAWLIVGLFLLTVIVVTLGLIGAGMLLGIGMGLVQ